MIVRECIIFLLLLGVVLADQTIPQSDPTDPNRIIGAKPNTIPVTDFIQILQAALETNKRKLVKQLADRADWLVRPISMDDREKIADKLTKNSDMIDALCTFIRRNPYARYPETLRSFEATLKRLPPGQFEYPIFQLHRAFPTIIESPYRSSLELLHNPILDPIHIERIIGEESLLSLSNLSMVPVRKAFAHLSKRFREDRGALLVRGLWRVVVAVSLGRKENPHDLVPLLSLFSNNVLGFTQIYYYTQDLFASIKVPNPTAADARLYQDGLIALGRESLPVSPCQDEGGESLILPTIGFGDGSMLEEEARVDVAIGLLCKATGRPVDFFSRPARPEKTITLIFNQIIFRHCMRYSGVYPGVLFATNR